MGKRIETRSVDLSLSHENKHRSGVAILVNSKQIYMEKVSNDLNGRILHVRIFYNSEILNIANIYAHLENRTEHKIIDSSKIYTLTFPYTTLQSSQEILIVLKTPS